MDQLLDGEAKVGARSCFVNVCLVGHGHVQLERMPFPPAYAGGQ